MVDTIDECTIYELFIFIPPITVDSSTYSTISNGANEPTRKYIICHIDIHSITFDTIFTALFVYGSVRTIHDDHTIWHLSTRIYCHHLV